MRKEPEAKEAYGHLGIDEAKEVYKHFGLDLDKMADERKEHEWGICPIEWAEKITNNMLRFGMGESHQIIIDYDKNYGWVLVRRYSKHGDSLQHPVYSMN